MPRLALVLVSLASTGHGRRLQRASEQTQRSSYGAHPNLHMGVDHLVADSLEEPNPLEGLLRILPAFSPSCAWQLTSAAHDLAANTAAGKRAAPIQMQTATDVKRSTFSGQQRRDIENMLDDRSRSVIDSLRGANLNDAEVAAEGTEMTLVEVERGDDELPLKYDPEGLALYFSKRPRAVLQRSLQIFSKMSGFTAKVALDLLTGKNDTATQTKRTSELRELVTSLGPFFIKIGQALSIRPDILPPESMVELQKLCDKVPSYDSKLAMQIIVDELGAPPEEIFSHITPEPLAAASLGQVYKANLRSTGEEVAVKVQRPFVLETVSLDLYLVRQIGKLIGQLPNREDRTDVVALVDEFAGRFYDELDYRIECENGIRIAENMASLPKVKIPKNFPAYTSRRVHTAEWVEGEKLAQSTAGDTLDLVNVGVVAYLTQLLGAGFFHADPHPGNMIRTPDGQLCILDFGLMTEINDDQKYGMIEAIVHLINRDYRDIGDDFKKLDFISKDVDVEPIIPPLTRVFDAALAGGGAKSINFNDLAADLAEITFEYPFRIPPYFALVIRAIGVLEGIALKGDPDFAIVDEAYPYISQRLLTADSPRMRAALRYMVYGREGVFDADRLIEMLNAFEMFDTVRQRAGGISYGSADKSVTAEEDEAARVSTALAFFFSPEGEFFREFLLDETARGVDVLSRSTLLRLPELVPGPAGAALRPLARLVPAPLRALVPDVTPDEEKTLQSITTVLDFFLNRNTSPASDTPGPTTQFDVNQAAQTAQRLRPVLQQYAGPMRDFGLQLASRLVELSSARAIDYTLDVVRGASMQPSSVMSSPALPRSTAR